MHHQCGPEPIKIPNPESKIHYTMPYDDHDISTPPVEPAAPVDEAPRTRWPTVFGVISIIYAIIGLSCATLQGAWLGAMDFIPEIFRGGVSMPLGVRLAFLGLLAPVFVLGIMLLSGGIGLVRRRRSSIGLLKKWVIGRIVMLIIGAVVYVMTAPAQIEIQKQSYQFMAKMMEENGQKAPPPLPSDDQIWHRLLIQTGIVSVLIAVYPFVLGMYLSGKKVTAEVAEWR